MKTTKSYARIFLLLIAFAFTSVGIAHAQEIVVSQNPNGVPHTTLAPPCDCKGWSGKPVKIVSPIKSAFVKCGGTVTLKKGPYTLASPVYFCTPSTCTPIYIWNITGPAIGTHTGITYPFLFTTAGTYTVTITPICGDHKCPPCIFKVVVTL